MSVFFVRNEDIMVSFVGDETLPAQKPLLTIAAKIFKGGMKPTSLDDFVGYAVKVEQDAAIHFESLAASMDQCGNHEVVKLFTQLAGFSRLRLSEAKRRAGSIDTTRLVPPDDVWPIIPHRTARRSGAYPAFSALSLQRPNPRL
jgi:hypothetical protein